MHPTFNILQVLVPGSRVIDGPSGAIATVLVPVVYRNADGIPGQTSIVTMGNAGEWGMGEWGMGSAVVQSTSTWYA